MQSSGSRVIGRKSLSLYISIDKAKVVPSQDLGCMQFFLSDIYTRKSGMQWDSKEMSNSGSASKDLESR